MILTIATIFGLVTPLDRYMPVAEWESLHQASNVEVLTVIMKKLDELEHQLDRIEVLLEDDNRFLIKEYREFPEYGEAIIQKDED